MPQTPARIEHDHGPPVLFEEFDLDSWQIRFLTAYALVGTVEGAARKSKINSCYHYRWNKNNADYSQAYKEALEVFVTSVGEGAFVQRGLLGYKKELSYKGKLTGHKTTEYSDALAQSYMKAHDSRYRDGQVIAVGPTKIAIEITGAAGDLTRDLTQPNNVEINVSADLPALENKAPSDPGFHNSSETAKSAISQANLPQRLIKHKK